MGPVASAYKSIRYCLRGGPNSEEWLTITTQVEDPQSLRTPKLIAPVFKKEPNGAKWDPTPCSSRW